MSSTRRRRAVMATDSEWERIGSAAQAAGMDISRFIVQRALMPDSLPPEVMRRAVREMLVVSRLEERRASAKSVLAKPGKPPVMRWTAGLSARGPWTS